MEKNGKKPKLDFNDDSNFGLGRNLDDLLDDNSEISTMKNIVVIRKEDGTKMKIYDKTKGDK